jgi:pimeloyl-ACP methyl ester carboxylesterase
VDEPLRRVCLERIVELEGVRLRLRDWPGRRGPLVHVADPLDDATNAIDTLAAALAWRYRVLSLRPRRASPYQVDFADLLATLDQFGFQRPILIGEKLGCVPALLVAAWQAGRVAGLVLLDPTYDPPPTDGIPARALRDCPPDWPSLRDAVACPVLGLRWGASAVDELETFLDQLARPGS